jgi:hypothetical protein
MPQLVIGLVLAEAVVAASVVVAGLGKCRLQVEVRAAEVAVLEVVVGVAQGVLGVAAGPPPRLVHLNPLHLGHRILAMLEQNQQVPRAVDYQL